MADPGAKQVGTHRALFEGMVKVPEGLADLKEAVIGCAIEVHRALGPGLLESVYAECLGLELAAAGLACESQTLVPLVYRGQRIHTGLRLDFLVDGCLVIELKAVERMNPLYLAQVITYLKMSGHPAGLLLNFNTTSLRSGLRRLEHPDLYCRRARD